MLTCAACLTSKDKIGFLLRASCLIPLILTLEKVREGILGHHQLDCIVVIISLYRCSGQNMPPLLVCLLERNRVLKFE